MLNIRQIIKNPPEELIIEIAKQIVTNRMFDKDLGVDISRLASKEKVREIIEVMWNGKTDTDAKQRFNYIRDAKIALETIDSYLDKKSQ